MLYGNMGIPVFCPIKKGLIITIVVFLLLKSYIQQGTNLYIFKKLSIFNRKGKIKAYLHL